MLLNGDDDDFDGGFVEVMNDDVGDDCKNHCCRHRSLNSMQNVRVNWSIGCVSRLIE